MEGPSAMMAPGETGLIDDEIRQSTLVRAGIEEVYDAIATAGGLDGWFTTGAEVDARPAGSDTSRHRPPARRSRQPSGSPGRAWAA